MATIKQHSLKEFRLRANLPVYFRYAAVILLAATVVAVIIGFYRGRAKTPFRIKSEQTQLSTDVVAEVNQYERLETDGGISKYYITADHAKTFSDNHQELQNVFVRTYDPQGAEADTMTAGSALYIPEEDKNFTAYLNGDVHINTRDGLKVVTNNIIYSKKTEIADADEAVVFERDNIHGKSFGATVKMAEKRIELLRDVEIETFDSPEMAKSGIRYAKVTAASASFDQAANKIELNTNVAINIQSKSASGGPKTTDVKADRAVLYLSGEAVGNDPKNVSLKKFELFDNVSIATVDAGGPPTNIEGGYALYDKLADRFELKSGAHIVTNANDRPTDIKAAEIVYEQTALKATLSGNAEITQGTDVIKGDRIDAGLFADQKVRNVRVSGNGFVRQVAENRTTTVTAPEINADWGDTRQLTAANTAGDSLARIEPKGKSDYSLVTLAAPKAIHLVFKGEGLLSSLKTEGRTTVSFDAAGSDAGKSNKRVIADTVNTYFYDSGKDIRRTEAIGNAELYIDPLVATRENYKTTITAPRFDCDFYPTGSNTKLCVGGKRTKTVRVPTVDAEIRGTQTLTADTLSAAFNESSRDIERLDAVGNSKFTELEHSATSATMTYTQADATVRLRGGDPTAWDGSSRARAKEIDWDTRAKHSYLRGGVSTTYYSRTKMGDSAPFASSDKPVFITSRDADFDLDAKVTTFTGNARGWQENNYVRSDRLIIWQTEGKMFADGNVQSALFDAKQKAGSKNADVPVYASSRTLAYDKNSRVLQYNENTDIRQGTDRLTAGKTDVYLTEKNEVSKTIAQTSVVLTQPGRKATGDWVQYTTADEVAILRGSPANVSDAENGSSQAAELTFFMRDRRVISEGRSKPNGAGRLRNVYKVKPTQ